MTSRSILFDRDQHGVVEEKLQEPAFFGDLHLDQVAAAVTAGREEYNLVPFFYEPLHELEGVRYRHHVLRDLEQDVVLEAVREFGRGLHEMRRHLSLVEKLHYARQSQRWFLEAVAAYCSAVKSFLERLSSLRLDSHGFVALREYLAGYAESAEFTALVDETCGLRQELAAVGYTVLTKGNRDRVGRYEQEANMSEEIEQTFATFQRGAVRDHRVTFREHAEMNHVEAQILDLVAKLHPETFEKLNGYCARRSGYLDATISRFDREVQFYVGYLDHIAPLKARGLEFAYPRVSARSKEENIGRSFDLALAAKLAKEDRTVVCNDFELRDPERILVVSGPNNGGKTTFARTVGQVHYLAMLGLPVPGIDARLFLPDRIFTHFEREKEIETLRGKFEDELLRIHEILEQATGASLLIMNESFGSTTLRDALLVGTEVMRQIIELEALCAFVTFVDELASLDESTVSMMSTVVPDDPAVRTFKVVRKPADGLAYAAAIAEKYGLTDDALRRRIAR